MAQRSNGSDSPARSPRALRLAIVGAAIVATALCLLLVGSSSPLTPGEEADAQESFDLDALAVAQPAIESDGLMSGDRDRYPYSVVSGGVHSPEELAAAVSDPVVARHYSQVKTADTRVTTVPTARRAYVSYRIGDRVYWTKKPIALHAGERVLTDGTTEIRARCGNLISDSPQEPTAADEPDEAEFDRAIAPSASPPSLPRFLVADAPLPSSGSVESPLASLGQMPLGEPAIRRGLSEGDNVGGGIGGPSHGLGVGKNVPLGGELARSLADAGPPSLFSDPPGDDGPPFLPPDGPHDPPGTPLVPPPGLTPPGPEQPVPVPEPGSMILLGTGLAGCAARAWRKRRQRSR